jgi:type IV pilus assembly protein PilB
MQPNENYVLDLLQDAGLVSRKQIESARTKLNGANNIVDLLVKDGVVSDADVSRTLVAQAHMDWVDISARIIPPDVIKQVRGEDARRFKVIPVAFGESGLVVAISDPLDIDTIDSLSFVRSGLLLWPFYFRLSSVVSTFSLPSSKLTGLA